MGQEHEAPTHLIEISKSSHAALVTKNKMEAVEDNCMVAMCIQATIEMI